MRKMNMIAVLATGMALTGCTLYGPAGEGRNSHLYGVATAQNINAQIAYGDPASRIRALNDLRLRQYRAGQFGTRRA